MEVWNTFSLDNFFFEAIFCEITVFGAHDHFCMKDASHNKNEHNFFVGNEVLNTAFKFFPQKKLHRRVKPEKPILGNIFRHIMWFCWANFFQKQKGSFLSGSTPCQFREYRSKLQPVWCVLIYKRINNTDL